jgi:large subunit ribosomal protein L28
MAKRCELTGKGVLVGHRVSHSNIKTNHRFLPNLKTKRFWSDDLKKFVSLKVSATAIRTIDKLGLDAYCRREGLKLK